MKLFNEDNIEALKSLPDNSVDSVVTDPPYGLSFMNKKWDYDVPSVDFWKEVLRVLKPGGHVLSFGGTRTYHRMVVNMEDAGFEIRDQIMWVYGSGFPKSLNIGKAVDKLEGREREVVGKLENYQDKRGLNGQVNVGDLAKERIDIPLTKGTSPWEGFGTALKPANEPICLARKPLSEKSVAENVLKWGAGGINVDGCRVGTTDTYTYPNGPKGNSFSVGKEPDGKRTEPVEMNPEGRFPANLILECCCDEVIKGERGEVIKSGGSREGCELSHEWGYDNIVRTNFTDKGDIHTNPNCPCRIMDGQSLGSSRFFYQAKVSKAERNMGLDGFEIKINIGTIKLLIYKRKNEILWERQDLNQTHQVDTEQSHQKDTEEFTTKEECVWNTELFGNYIVEKFQKDIKSITEMKTNSITIYQTLNSLIQKSTKEYIATQQKELMGGIKFVESADKKNTKAIITYQKKDGSNQSVSLVSLKEVWSISVEEEVKSNHPTMKPINLLTYLIRLITPQNGIVLDPFMGSGSTGIAARLQGFDFIGMEMDSDYFKIAEKRIEKYEDYKIILKK